MVSCCRVATTQVYVWRSTLDNTSLKLRHGIKIISKTVSLDRLGFQRSEAVQSAHKRRIMAKTVPMVRIRTVKMIIMDKTIWTRDASRPTSR